MRTWVAEQKSEDCPDDPLVGRCIVCATLVWWTQRTVGVLLTEDVQVDQKWKEPKLGGHGSESQLAKDFRCICNGQHCGRVNHFLWNRKEIGLKRREA